MAIDSAILLPSRGEGTSHWLCGCVGKQSIHVADVILKPAVAVTPPGPWMAAKVGAPEVCSCHSGGPDSQPFHPRKYNSAVLCRESFLEAESRSCLSNDFGNS